MSSTYKLLIIPFIAILLLLEMASSVKTRQRELQTQRGNRRIRSISMSVKQDSGKTSTLSRSSVVSEPIAGELSTKILLGSPLEFKNQADYPTSHSIKHNVKT